MCGIFPGVLKPLSGMFFSSSFRFEGVGIYIVMFLEIMRTLVRVVVLFFFLMLAFSVAFYALMLNQVQGGRGTLAHLRSECALKLFFTLRKSFKTCRSR